MVFGVGTSKDIMIYEVLYSAKSRKISFNMILSKAVRRTALNLTLAHKKKKKKKKKDLVSVVSDDMCSSVYVSLTRIGITSGI